MAQLSSINFFSLVDKPSCQTSNDLNASPFLMQSWVGESQRYNAMSRAATNKNFLKFLRYVFIT